MTTKTVNSTISQNSQELSNASASSAMKLFENPQFRIRVIMLCADPWFVANDACDCLNIANVSQACQTLDEDEKGICKVDTLGGKQEISISTPSIMAKRVLRALTQKTVGRKDNFDSHVLCFARFLA